MRDRRMDAYYYGFDKTGSEDVDRILSAVACAGKAHHHTSDWAEDCDWPSEPEITGKCPVEWIQNAANAAARRLASHKSALSGAVEWMAEDGCDCGADEEGSCALCLCRAALNELAGVR